MFCALFRAFFTIDTAGALKLLILQVDLFCALFRAFLLLILQGDMFCALFRAF